TRRRAEARREVLGEDARGDARLLRELERNVRRPVTVLTLAGSLDVDGRRDVLGRQGQGAVSDGGGEGGTDRVGELVGSHRAILARLLAALLLRSEEETVDKD